jgi:cytochrome P450
VADVLPRRDQRAAQAARRRPHQRLVTARLHDQAALDDDEATAVLIQLLIAGFVSTADLIGSTISVLLAHPEHWIAATGNPSLVPELLEEALRAASPLMLATRTTTEPVELGGCLIPKGGRLRLMLGSANRDEAHFEHPHRFDSVRHGSRHIAFGLGAHFCVGATLARLEGRVALEEIMRRLPGLRHAPAAQQRYRRSVVFRGLERLDVEWDLA